MSNSPFYKTGVSKSPLLDIRLYKHGHGDKQRKQKPRKKTGYVELPMDWRENNS